MLLTVRHLTKRVRIHKQGILEPGKAIAVETRPLTHAEVGVVERSGLAVFRGDLEDDDAIGPSGVNILVLARDQFSLRRDGWADGK